MKTIIKLILIHRIFLIVISFSCLLLIPMLKIPQHGGFSNKKIYQGNDNYYQYIVPENHIKKIFSPWDSIWYISIAEEGYSEQKKPYEKIDNKGFLPLYPILIYIFSNIFFMGETVLTGIILSNIFLILSFYVLKKFIHSETNLKDKVVINEVYLYILLLPTSFYLSAVYPESLYLFLSIFSLYLLNKNKLILASLIMGLTFITKIYGIFLIIPFVFYIYRNRKKIKLQTYFLSGLAMTLPMTIYLIHIYYVSGDLFAYMNIQNKFFNHTWSNPIEIIFLDMFYRMNVQKLFNAIATVVGIFIILLGYKKIKIEYIIYSLMYLLFAPTTGMTSSNARYILSIFFIPIILSILIKKNEYKILSFSALAFIQGFVLLWWIVGSGIVA